MATARVSVVVPAHHASDQLEACLRSIAAAQPPPVERILVCDGELADVQTMGVRLGFLVVRGMGRRGAAAARNVGARQATGDVVLFLDSDVAVPPDLVGRVAEAFRQASALTALVGSYDDQPAEYALVSQYRNLLHHFVHQEANADASTFWGACGAVRRAAFLEVGGFDEGYQASSVEDIELGGRLKDAGGVIRLDRELQVKHLKRWTLGSYLWTDLFRRSLPWTRIMLRQRRMPNDLNLRTRHRLSLAASFGLVTSLGAALHRPDWGWLPAAFAAAFLGLNARFLAFLWERGGARLALLAVPLHLLHSLAGGLGVVLGLAGHAVSAARAAASSLTSRARAEGR